jgi:hypothetical protein
VLTVGTLDATDGLSRDEGTVGIDEQAEPSRATTRHT